MATAREALYYVGWSALASSPLPTALLGPEGSILEANQAFSTFLGRRRGALLAMRVGELVHPDDAPLRRAGRPPLPPGPAELRWVRQDGSLGRGSARTWPVSSDAPGVDAPEVYVCQVEEAGNHPAPAIREMAEVSRLIIDNVADYGIYLLDADGTIVSWNAGAQRIKGYEAREIIGQPYRVFFTPADVAEGVPDRNLADAARDGRAAGEGRRVRRDGTEFWARWSLTALRDDGRLTGFAKVTQDITELTEARRSLHDYARRLEEAIEMRDDILAVAQHELRTPLTIVTGFADTLARHRSRLDDAQVDTAIRAMGSAGRRLQGLVENLLALSALQSARQSLASETVTVSTAVRDGITLADLDDQLLVIDVPDALRVVGDPKRMRQIVANLVSNAAIYGRPPIEVSAWEEDDWAVIAVTDHGTGVPVGFVPHLFDRFTQASRGATRTAVGTGLGLAAVRELTEAQGGRASYEPNAPEGARFLVRLPLVPDGAAVRA